jgi:hypothetical protein
MVDKDLAFLILSLNSCRIPVAEYQIYENKPKKGNNPIKTGSGFRN